MASSLERQPLLASTNGSSGVEEQVQEQEVVSSRGGDLGLFFSLLVESIPGAFGYMSSLRNRMTCSHSGALLYATKLYPDSMRFSHRTPWTP
jgi:hypothetical protein